MRKLIRWVALIASAAVSISAYAQLRTLPAAAKRTTVGKLQQMPYVELGGKVVKLAPGAVIYDQNNRSLVQGALPSGSDVAYTTDMHGEIARIYILTPHEQAQLAAKKK